MKTYTYSYQNGLCRGREAGRIPAPSSVRVGAYRIRPPDGPERGRIHVPNARTTVGAYCIRPPNIPQGMNDHTPGTCIRHRWWRPVGRMLLRLLHGYPHQQTNGAQAPTNQHQTGHRPEWMDAGYDHSPRVGVPGGAYAIRPYPTGRRAFQYPANLAGVPDAPGKLRRRPQTPPAKFAGVRRHPAANAERLAPPAQTPRQMPRDLRELPQTPR